MDTIVVGHINANKVDDISNACWLSPKQGAEPGQWFMRKGELINQFFMNDIPYGMVEELIERRVTPRETSVEPEIFIGGRSFEGSNEKKKQKIAEAALSGEELVFEYRHLYTMEYLRDNFIPYPYKTRHATIGGLDGIDTSITVDQFLQNYLVPAFIIFGVEPYSIELVFSTGGSFNFHRPNIIFKGDINIICEEWIKTVIDEYNWEPATPVKHILAVTEYPMDPSSLNFKQIPNISIFYMRIRTD
jgi:hypothetical protein